MLPHSRTSPSATASSPCNTSGRSRRFTPALSLLLAASLALAPIACQHEELDPFDPKKLGDNQRLSSRDQATANLRPLPTTYRAWEPTNRTGQGRAGRPRGAGWATTDPNGKLDEASRPRRTISLADVIRRTVSNSLDVQAAGYGPGIEAARIIEAEARFDPTLFSSFTAEVTNRQTGGNLYTPPSTQPLGRQTVLLDRNRQSVFTGATGIRQILESGGQLEARYQLRQTDANPNQFLLDPYREADLVIQITQPLLRDFGQEVNRARIDIARNTSRISLLDFRKSVEDATLNIEQAYWQLVAAQREVEIQEQRVRGAEQTADVISQRLELDQSQVQLNQAQAEAETRRANLIRARSRVNDLSDQIKQLMNDPDMPVGSPEVLVAESGPLDQPVRFDLDELIDSALQNRLELGQQQLRIDNATITTNAAKNNLLPNLQFQGQINPSGLGSGFDNAIDSQSDFNKISYSAGLQLEIPIGNREARAIYRRTQLQRSQAIAQYRSLQEQVVLDVRVQHRDVETSFQELARSREARFARERSLRGILAQEAAREPLTPQFVDLKLRYQDFLAEAQSAEATALSNYNVAIARLERAKGTLLRYNNISLDEKGLRRQLAK